MVAAFAVVRFQSRLFVASLVDVRGIGEGHEKST